MKMVIRKAEPEDCPQMLELVRELAVYERQPDAVTVSMEEFVDAGFGPQPVWEAFVAEVELENQPIIVGISLFYIRYSTWKGRRLYLEDIVVTEKMRGRGIGKQLFDRTLELCKQRGYNGMVWQALDWNEPALAFYRKYGANFDNEWINISLETDN
ncbi:MAG TPA: GNAT family N-acetyltransferase [Sphingobacteriaceae bacterium]|nr:GNAT family N-acetyltransferase [Sphingobacteriaceae bacterium]